MNMAKKKKTTEKATKKSKKEEIIEKTVVENVPSVEVEVKEAESVVLEPTEGTKADEPTDTPETTENAENATEEVKDEVIEEEVKEEVPAPVLLFTSMPHDKIVICSTSGKVKNLKTGEVRAAWVDKRNAQGSYLPIL